LGPLSFLAPPARIPKLPDEESPLPPSMGNHKFVVVEIEEKNDDFDPGYYLSSLTPKEV
jgi:hypothetical protein